MGRWEDDVPGREDDRSPERPLSASLRPSIPVDLGLTLWPLRRGRGDPTVRADPDGSWWRATRTPEGPATIHVARRADRILLHAWGPGAEWMLAGAPDLVGLRDRTEGFDPPRGIVRELHRRMPGLRIGRTQAVFEAVLASILEQKVAGRQARASLRALVLAAPEPAPGPGRLLLPPSAHQVAAMRYQDFHRFGVEMRRANAIRVAAGAGPRLDRAAGLPLPQAYRLLRSLPGVGPWTAAEVAMVALGDPDAVSVGDFHLPHQVAWVLAGEPRADDARMLELLEPYRGHRGRVIRLIGASGMGPPRFGPRQPLRSFASS